MSVFPSDGKLPHTTECKKSTQSSNDLSLRVVPFNIQINYVYDIENDEPIRLNLNSEHYTFQSNLSYQYLYG